MLKASGYSGQLKNMNAYDALYLFKNGIRVDMKYFVNVYQDLVDRMVAYLQNNNASLHLNVRVKDIFKTDKHDEHYIIEMHENGLQLRTRKVICCIPQKSLVKLTCMAPFRKILQNSITCKPLCRVYALFDTNNRWFESLKKKIIVNNQLRYIIPISVEKGLIMISYTDGEYTKYWNKMKDNQTKLKGSIVKLIKKTFDIQVNEPIKVFVCYWECGVAYYNKNVNSIAVSEFITNPINNLYICGENYSREQSWVEGALESCDRCLRLQDNKII